LAPSLSDYHNANDPVHFKFLIELGLLCQSLTDLVVFEPSALLESLMRRQFDDAVIVALARRLCHHGALVSEEAFERFEKRHPNHPETIAVLRDAIQNPPEEIKEPGFD
jgi:hypothetical protein